MSGITGEKRLMEIIQKRVTPKLPIDLRDGEIEIIVEAIRQTGHEFAEWRIARAGIRPKLARKNSGSVVSAEFKKDWVTDLFEQYCETMGADIMAVLARSRGTVETTTARQVCTVWFYEQHPEHKDNWNVCARGTGRDRNSIRHNHEVGLNLKETNDALFMHYYKLLKNDTTN